MVGLHESAEALSAINWCDRQIFWKVWVCWVCVVYTLVVEPLAGSCSNILLVKSTATKLPDTNSLKMVVLWCKRRIPPSQPLTLSQPSLYCPLSSHQQDVSAATYLASSSYTGTVLGPFWWNKICFTILSMSDSRRGCVYPSAKLLNFSLGNALSLSDP